MRNNLLPVINILSGLFVQYTDFQSKTAMQKINIQVHYLSSKGAKSFTEGLNNIIDQLEQLPKTKIPLKLTFFTSCKGNSIYGKELYAIQNMDRLMPYIATPVLISQQPIGNGEIALELMTISTEGIDYKIIKGDRYFILIAKDFKLLFANANSFEENSFQKNAETTFNRLDNILEVTDFEYSDIIRQWNYIENILNQQSENEKIKNNYQVFNAYRSIIYSKSEFKNGYPAATAIGTINGGCCVEIIALKGKNSRIIPIQNSRQIDAHSYSNKVLIGSSLDKLKIVASPKFERAKLIQIGGIEFLLISGTASIIGEKTVCKEDIEQQILTTIENIEILLKSTLEKSGKKQYFLLNYRTYIKNPEDYNTVKTICNKKYGENKGILLISDICRDNLLVEIECNYIF
jgi:enamine deaminase RidA (YjgF/YER057c/UK114 family)